jgi:hypothetical protein
VSKVRSRADVLGFRAPTLLGQSYDALFVQHEKPCVELLQVGARRLIQETARSRSCGHGATELARPSRLADCTK